MDHEPTALKTIRGHAAQRDLKEALLANQSTAPVLPVPAFLPTSPGAAGAGGTDDVQQDVPGHGLESLLYFLISLVMEGTIS